MVDPLPPEEPQIMYLGTRRPPFIAATMRESWKRLPIVEPAGMVRMGFPCRIIRLAADPTSQRNSTRAIGLAGDPQPGWRRDPGATVRRVTQIPRTGTSQEQLASDTADRGHDGLPTR